MSNQVGIGYAHRQEIADVPGGFVLAERKDMSLVVKESIGVAGLITPWTWLLNQITCKVGPALAAGCTMVLEPSDIASLNAIVFAEILDAAGVPPGLSTLVNGDGPTVGPALARHPDVDRVSSRARPAPTSW